MKKIQYIVTAVLLLIWFPYHGNAQHMGAKGGLNMANFAGESADNMEYRAGGILGAYVYLPVTSQFGIQPEIYYSQRGSRSDGTIGETDIDARIDMQYIDLPVLAVLHTRTGLRFYGGPGMAFFLDGTIHTEATGQLLGWDVNESGTSEINENDVKSPSVFLSGGVGYNFGGMTLDLRYHRSVENVWDTPSEDNELQHSDIQIMLGIPF
ncbi:MAG: PorT family protein [Candidatus Marinimicrobia bacterium]|nr:PorT family protein [Candidatus Neomarinimicrobiota bacterium]MCF7827949.1 PorT family protein [Candidatus Neomarinimicrobiota bacterium]MCF7879296.1 PorT family protein [Candidatus Neomarinimicrobiota bacterium]